MHKVLVGSLTSPLKLVYVVLLLNSIINLCIFLIQSNFSYSSLHSDMFFTRVITSLHVVVCVHSSKDFTSLAPFLQFKFFLFLQNHQSAKALNIIWGLRICSFQVKSSNSQILNQLDHMDDQSSLGC